MLDRRLQILLDEERYRRVATEAAARGTSVASVVREAIDRTFPVPTARRRAAVRELLDADDMTVPEVDGLRAELEELRGRRA